MRYLICFTILLLAIASYAQKLSLGVNLGRAFASGFSYSSTPENADGFKISHHNKGGLSLAIDVEHHVNKRFSIGLLPSLLYSRGSIITQRTTANSITEITEGHQNLVIPFYMGYHVYPFKEKVHIKLTGGVSYMRYGLSYLLVSSKGGFSPGSSASSITDSISSTTSDFTVRQGMGYVLGMEIAPLKDLSRFSLFFRYYGRLDVAGFDQPGFGNEYHLTSSDGTITTKFTQSIKYQPGNFVIGMIYCFTLMK